MKDETLLLGPEVVYIPVKLKLQKSDTKEANGVSNVSN